MALPSTILVTGASGFVGRHVLPILRRDFPAARLIAGERPAGGPCPQADATIPLDLTRAASLEAAILEARPDAVLHLAAQASVPAAFADPLGSWQANLLGTVSLAEAVLRHRPQALFVHASTAEVYGLSFRSGAALDEMAGFAPANPYAASKAAADLALGEMALRGLRAIRMRPFNQVGAGQAEAYVVPAFARQVALIEAGRQEPVIRTGALDRWRDMLDVSDAAAGYAAALAHGGDLPPGTAINLASGTPRRVGDILAELIALAGLDVRIETDPGRLRPTDVETTRGDAALARRLLHWQPVIPWEASLAAILTDWRARIAAG
ncbi:MAG: GDP-mannose 4,6-dehydratase [Roseococcus sp.]|nr:GDP-mannose 4,6-dehydratase [Roseococcus sp.]